MRNICLWVYLVSVLVIAIGCQNEEVIANERLTNLTIEAGNTSLKFNSDSTFKIVQFTDIHWKGGADEQKQNNAESIEIMNSVLDAEKPDMVVFTGDIVVENPVKEGWIQVTEPMIKRKIPWAVVLGNHDDEGDMNRKEIVEFLETLAFNLTEAGPEDITGYGNYILKIKGAKSNNDEAVIYCLDSNAYAPFKGVGEYDWIRFDQIQWYRESSKEIRNTNGGKVLPALAFFHIPFPEYYMLWDFGECIGQKHEGVSCPLVNSGLYSAMLESGDVMGVFVGHDHDNDYIGNLFGIYLAYGRVTGVGNAYGIPSRGGRVNHFMEGKREFKTWIRTGDGEVVSRVHYPSSFKVLHPK